MWTITTEVPPIFFPKALLSTRRTFGLHLFSNSRRRICLEGMTRASLWTTQIVSTDRIHITSIWWENCCPLHDCTACLAFHFSAVQSTKAADTHSGAQGLLSWWHVPARVANLALRRTKMQEGREHYHGMLLLMTRFVLTGAHTSQGQALSADWMWSSARGSNCVPQTPKAEATGAIGTPPAPATHQSTGNPGGLEGPKLAGEGGCVGAGSRSLARERAKALQAPPTAPLCAVRCPQFKELMWTKYSKAFPGMLAGAECLGKNTPRIERKAALQKINAFSVFLKTYCNLFIFFQWFLFSFKIAKVWNDSFQSALLKSALG